MFNNRKKNFINKSKSIFDGIDLNKLGTSSNEGKKKINVKRSQSAIFIGDKEKEIFVDKSFNFKNNNYNINNNINDNNKRVFISERNDLNIINDVFEKNEQFCQIMKRRIKGLKNVVNFYNNKYYDIAINEIYSCKDLGVANDFFIYSIIKKDLHSEYLTLDHIIKLFPIILNLCDSKYDIYFKTGINSAWIILKLFYDRITTAKKNNFSYGVDLNREEKLKKYDIIFDYFYKLSNLDRLNYNLRKNIEGLNLIQFFGELDYFIKECLK